MQDGKKPLEVMLAQIRAIRANRFPGKDAGHVQIELGLSRYSPLCLLARSFWIQRSGNLFVNTTSTTVS